MARLANSIALLCIIFGMVKERSEMVLSWVCCVFIVFLYSSLYLVPWCVYCRWIYGGVASCDGMTHLSRALKTDVRKVDRHPPSLQHQGRLNSREINHWLECLGICREPGE
ncbi:hypothetical protein METBIDRAFT_99223 [Metschnikowia bicuspidata var. bicuspidata NRRL YB-4993]|uniref:Uncharacterized protein n=1 Tax=Metschnikowia bicuspidata var. bicuspidata NRRL YB-4993 TaxID=869754 RepID=A0A1A0HG37_9ASCO|nr:hypothetical protein METBIDRAFT_99223 [Metschnikowia bicuspidata var. bicuspidata NRRL YB-4993]OBA23124.1 hypothetical protein METBIDRAFT_99223 [Metschnikowia bicuspidata var. bicuspidata NRRL YB-4993]